MTVGTEAMLIGILDQDWLPDALCAQVDTDIFFPEKGGSSREAKAICAMCPVRQECLDWALESNERFGIWGGVSERGRRALSHGDGQDWHGTSGGYQRHRREGTYICAECREAHNARLRDYAHRRRIQGTRRAG